MENWQWTALLLCSFGFFKELRPSEPFVTKYLIQYKGFSKETIVHVAYPIATYTYFVALPIIFLVTDFLRYRPIIILEGVAFVTVFSMLIWTNGLTALTIIEIFYGLAGATQVAYYTYMYAKVDNVHYKKVTSYTYASVFGGNFVAAIISQCLVSYELMNYHELNFISLGGACVALVISVFLPSAAQSVYFYRHEPKLPKASVGADSDDKNVIQALVNGGGGGDDAVGGAICSSSNNNSAKDQNFVDGHLDNLTFLQRARRAYPILWSDFKNAYNLSKPNVLKWSVWWAIATAGHLQITNYYQTLWEEIQSGGKIYNGGVSAVQSALSMIFAFGVGHLRISWTKWGESVLCLISIIQGIDLIWFSQTTSLLTGYALLIVYRTLYQILITIASAEVAHGINEDSYGLIFGINTFAAVCIQTLLTLIINEEGSLALDIRPQFLVYGCYYGVLGLAFLVTAMCSGYCRRSSSTKRIEQGTDTDPNNHCNTCNNEESSKLNGDTEPETC